MWLETVAILHTQQLLPFICSDGGNQLSPPAATLYPQTAAPTSGIWLIFSDSSFQRDGSGEGEEENHSGGEREYEGLRD